MDRAENTQGFETGLGDSWGSTGSDGRPVGSHEGGYSRAGGGPHWQCPTVGGIGCAGGPGGEAGQPARGQATWARSGGSAPELDDDREAFLCSFIPSFIHSTKTFSMQTFRQALPGAGHTVAPVGPAGGRGAWQATANQSGQAGPPLLTQGTEAPLTPRGRLRKVGRSGGGEAGQGPLTGGRPWSPSARVVRSDGGSRGLRAQSRRPLAALAKGPSAVPGAPGRWTDSCGREDRGTVCPGSWAQDPPPWPAMHTLPAAPSQPAQPRAARPPPLTAWTRPRPSTGSSRSRSGRR